MRSQGGRLGLVLLALLGAGCAVGPRVVPVPAGGVVVDPATRSAAAESEGVRVVVRSSAWQGSPYYLPEYVTPFHLRLVNGNVLPLRFEYADVRLFDEARFQYTALPPAEVERLLYGRHGDPSGLVAGSVGFGFGFGHRFGHHPGFGHHYGFGFYFPYYYPYPYPYPYYYPYPYPYRPTDVFLQALAVGTLQAGAQSEGFVYFPRLRPEARRLTLEFHYRLGDAPRVLILAFAVERTAGEGVPPLALRLDPDRP